MHPGTQSSAPREMPNALMRTSQTTLGLAIVASLVLHALALAFVGPWPTFKLRARDDLAVFIAPPPQPPAAPISSIEPSPAAQPTPPPEVLKDTIERKPAPPAPASRPSLERPVAPPTAPTAAPKPESGAAARPARREVAESLSDTQLGEALSRLAETQFYPQEAIDRGIEGEVVLVIEVGEGGRIVDASVATSSGHRILDDAAVRAARRIGTISGASPGKAFLLRVPFKLM